MRDPDQVSRLERKRGYELLVDIISKISPIKYVKDLVSKFWKKRDLAEEDPRISKTLKRIQLRDIVPELLQRVEKDYRDIEEEWKKHSWRLPFVGVDKFPFQQEYRARIEGIFSRLEELVSPVLNEGECHVLQEVGEEYRRKMDYVFQKGGLSQWTERKLEEIIEEYAKEILLLLKVKEPYQKI